MLILITPLGGLHEIMCLPLSPPREFTRNRVFIPIASCAYPHHPPSEFNRNRVLGLILTKSPVYPYHPPSGFTRNRVFIPIASCAYPYDPPSEFTGKRVFVLVTPLGNSHELVCLSLLPP